MKETKIREYEFMKKKIKQELLIKYLRKLLFTYILDKSFICEFNTYNIIM